MITNYEKKEEAEKAMARALSKVYRQCIIEQIPMPRTENGLPVERIPTYKELHELELRGFGEIRTHSMNSLSSK